MKTGVYKISSEANGKVYIGSSVNITRRLRWHKAALNRGGHHSYHLQRAWDKYGPDAFKFEELILCRRCDLAEYEQAAIDGYNSHDRASGYNVSPSAYSTAGFEFTEEQKQSLKVKAREAARKYDWRGQELCLTEIEETEGLPAGTLVRKVAEYGWDLERAVSYTNTTKAIFITAWGRTQRATDWSKEMGVSYSTIKSRLRRGISGEDAVSPAKPQSKIIEHNGKTKNINQWAKETGIPAWAISQRITKLGWSVEDALTLQVNERRPE